MVVTIKKPKIIGLGEILWDMLPDGKVWGGAPANFAYHCSQLGAESYVVSAIGNDDLGAEIRENVERLNLSTDYIFTDEKIPTSTVTVKLDEHGHPEYTIHEDVAWDNLPVEQSALDPEDFRDITFYEGGGCIDCNGTGFRGREAIAELLDMSDRIRELILDRRSSAEIKRAAREEGMLTLRESAVHKARKGITTLREINKVTFVE